MNRIGRLTAMSAVLAAGLLALTVTNQVAAFDDKESAEAIKQVVEIAGGKDVEEGKVDEAKTKAVHKKYEDLNTVMHIYKPRDKGGLGTGPKSKGDGIEFKLNNLGSKSPLAPMTLEKEKDELIKIARISVVMAEISKHYAPEKPKAGKGKKDWNQYADEMKKASVDMIKAAQKGDPVGLKKAANNVNSACNSCHSDFRDAP